MTASAPAAASRYPQGAAALAPIITGALILQVAGTAIHTYVPLYMALADRAPFMIGLVGAGYSAGFLVGCFTIPVLIRRVGHIRAFAVFAAVQAAVTLCLALTPVDLWTVLRFVVGAASAGHFVCIESWISGQAEPARRGRIFGLYQMLNRLALILSQVAVGYLALRMESMFMLASIAFSLALVPVALTKARSPDTPPLVSVNLRALWRDAPTAVGGCLYVGLVGGALSYVAPAYGIMIGLDREGAILLTVASQVGALVMQWPMGLFADRIDTRNVMLASVGLALAASAATLWAVHHDVPHLLWVMTGLFTLVGAGSMPIYAISVTHAYRHIEQDQAVSLSAALLFLWAAGASAGPLLASALMQIVGPHGLLGYIVGLSALMLVFLGYRIARKTSPGRPAAEGGIGAGAVPDVGPRH
ncbi:MFS transporter [Pseudochelatococcus lubricantis]|uniref:MFS transporter n=1 Tax=Pseudochelatococcus lubricantis TaxID=1538102 RepID=UPI0035E51009